MVAIDAPSTWELEGGVLIASFRVFCDSRMKQSLNLEMKNGLFVTTGLSRSCGMVVGQVVNSIQGNKLNGAHFYHNNYRYPKNLRGHFLVFFEKLSSIAAVERRGGTINFNIFKCT